MLLTKKKKLQFETKLKEHLKVIRKKNSIEIKSCLNFLTQLSLSNKKALDLNQDKDFLSELETKYNK